MTGEACHVCITGSRLFAHSYANRILIGVNGSANKELCLVKLLNFISYPAFLRSRVLKISNKQMMFP